MSPSFTKRWIVGSIRKDTREHSISSYPVYHETRQSAIDEAKRLASINSEKAFFVSEVSVCFYTPTPGIIMGGTYEIGSVKRSMS